MVYQLKGHFWPLCIIDSQIVDFGAAECKFLRRARNALSDSVRKFVGVDVDGDLLKKSTEFLKPKVDVVEQMRERPRTAVLLFKGSVAEYDGRMFSADAVVAIELIEHLEQNTLDALPQVIFGRMKPYVAIFTTPNVEFNVLFDMGNRRFRHWDHKFEWSRGEFQEWCFKIVLRYPEYRVDFDGVGRDPNSSDWEALGPCSQMAIFRHEDKAAYFKLKETKIAAAKARHTGPKDTLPYQLVSKIIDAPMLTRSQKWQILSECRTYCDRLLEEAIKSGNQGVGLSFGDLFECSKYVKEHCHDAATLARLFILRDDFDWRIRIDLTGSGIYVDSDQSDSDKQSDDE